MYSDSNEIQIAWQKFSHYSTIASIYCVKEVTFCADNVNV